MIGVEKAVSVELATFSEPERGSLTVVQSAQDLPFPIVRVFYVYGMPQKCERGAHAHRETEQGFIAIKGSFSLELTDTRQTKTYSLSEPDHAVYVPAMIWARMHDFSEDAVCLVLASSLYDPADYIRDWDEYVSAVKKLSL